MPDSIPYSAIPVAVANSRGEFLNPGADVQRFHREARVIAALNHPNPNGGSSVNEAAGRRWQVNRKACLPEPIGERAPKSTRPAGPA